MTTPRDLVDLMAKLHGGQYQAAVHAAYGDQGIERLTALFEAARELLLHVPCEMLTTGVDVIVAVEDSGNPLAEGGATVQDLSELSGQPRAALTVEIRGGTFRVWSTKGAVDASTAAPHLRYEYVHRRREEVHVDGRAWPVNDGPWPCMLATRSFATLDEALAAYMSANRIPEQCPHLDSTWRDDMRLAFRDKPEADMRRSLILALRYCLGGVAQVRPEQNQSETKPVDIEINWWGMKRSAIIEIKWLGCSGPVGASAFTTTYTQARAVSGLRQLADYLNLRASTSSDVPVMGYLFVFDARRQGLTATQTSISRAHGLHYALSDPPYPHDILDRPDMGHPYRCFMEPICTD